MWRTIVGILNADLQRLWRRLLRRPERPGPFSMYRRPEDSGSSPGDTTAPPPR